MLKDIIVLLPRKFLGHYFKENQVILHFGVKINEGGKGYCVLDDDFSTLVIEKSLLSNFFVSDHSCQEKMTRYETPLTPYLLNDALLLIREGNLLGIIFFSDYSYIGILPFVDEFDFSHFTKADFSDYDI